MEQRRHTIRNCGRLDAAARCNSCGWEEKKVAVEAKQDSPVGMRMEVNTIGTDTDSIGRGSERRTLQANYWAQQRKRNGRNLRQAVAEAKRNIRTLSGRPALKGKAVV